MWIHACGSMHVDPCMWIHACGSMHVDPCMWIHACGSMHVNQSASVFHPSSLPSSPSTWGEKHSCVAFACMCLCAFLPQPPLPPPIPSLTPLPSSPRMRPLTCGEKRSSVACACMRESRSGGAAMAALIAASSCCCWCSWQDDCSALCVCVRLSVPSYPTSSLPPPPPFSPTPLSLPSHPPPSPHNPPTLLNPSRTSPVTYLQRKAQQRGMRLHEGEQERGGAAMAALIAASSCCCWCSWQDDCSALCVCVRLSVPSYPTSSLPPPSLLSQPLPYPPTLLPPLITPPHFSTPPALPHTYLRRKAQQRGMRLHEGEQERGGGHGSIDRSKQLLLLVLVARRLERLVEPWSLAQPTLQDSTARHGTAQKNDV
ncbi:unnamed protein product [Closterium sp. NIES-64]|nr:unnamed protein product [Closterium sp. NIES-64]